jgi:hypothetical protein
MRFRGGVNNGIYVTKKYPANSNGASLGLCKESISWIKENYRGVRQNILPMLVTHTLRGSLGVCQ